MMEQKFKKYLGIRMRVENDGKKREEAIKNDIPVRFEIKRDREQFEKLNLWDDIYNADSLGNKAVAQHDDKILKYSKKHDLDPDMLRAVMFAENSRGHKMGLNYIADKMGRSNSIMPMNIQKDRWESLVDKKPEDMYDPDINIEAATVLLRRISDRIERATPEKVGTLWNDMDNLKTNEFGEYVGKVYRGKPWKK